MCKDLPEGRDQISIFLTIIIYYLDCHVEEQSGECKEVVVEMKKASGAWKVFMRRYQHRLNVRVRERRFPG